MKDQLQSRSARIKLAVIKAVAKNTSITISGPRFLFLKDAEETSGCDKVSQDKTPFWGIWHYCHNCDEVDFVDIHDPWSNSSRSYCSQCGEVKTYSPNSITPAFSFAYWKICSNIAWERFPENSRKRRIEFAKLKWLGLDPDAIPLNREGQTLEDLETMSSMFIFSILMR